MPSRNSSADKQAFANLYANPYTRTFGGTNKGTADPFISGYFGCYFQDLPQALTTDKVNQLGFGNSIQKVLSAVALSVTVPALAINKTTFTGIGGKKWSVISNIDVGDSLTVRFTEFSGVPIGKILYSWGKIGRSMRHHTSALACGEYTKSQYAASLYYWTMRPSMNPCAQDVEVAFCFTGCFPNKVPLDSYGGDVATNDKVEIDVDFNVDEVFCTMEKDNQWVMDKVVTIMGNVLNYGQLKTDISEGNLGGPNNK
ncbi:hypothetical protein M0R19_09415 [Candidatus Pacearchaeota archaeon]|jgi:hypothetical protein|nr:hypothetical protein [Candidatus Pacearchaeota archaeon]